MDSLVPSFRGLTVSRVEPLEHQVEWFDRIVKLFHSGELIIIDTSSMGCGKTFGPLWAAQSFGCPIFVVGPAGNKSTWLPTCAEYGIKIVDYLSYSALSGTETDGSRNRWLIRDDHRADDKVNGALGARTTTYEPSYELVLLLVSGVIFVFDEFQSTTSGKGNTYFKATKALMDALRTYPSSRAMFLSATPFKKETEVLTFLPLLGCLTPGKDMLGPKKRGSETLSFRERMEGFGLGEIYNRCMKYDPVVTEEIIDSVGKKTQNASLAKALAVDLYVRVISQHIGGFMKQLKSDIYKCYFYNFYCPLSSSSYAAISRAIDMFQREVHYDATNDRIMRPPGKGFGEDVASLQAIHSCLLEPLFIQVMKQLTEKPNTKAVLFTYYLHCIDELLYLFRGNADVEVISGKSDTSSRQSIADRFRFPGGPRVLICNGSVGAVGLSMHSTTPGLEIYAYSLPFWNVIMCHQQTGRIYRADKGGIVNNAYFHIIYPPREKALCLQRINNALTEASKFMIKCIDGIEAKSLPANYEDKEAS